MLGALPKVEDLGIRWATLDDRWFDAFGDWQPRPEAFPGDSIRYVVRAYHARGVRLQIWWVPLAVEAGDALPRGTRHRTADVVERHPEWLVLDESGLPARTVRGLSVLCPAVPGVREYHRRLVRRFIGEWGFDGHKLDAAFTVPRCHNPRHHHRSPDDSLAALGRLYEDILSETRALKPDAVVQICPCGTPPHHVWLPFLTQAVAADPWGSAQRRRRIKMYKALLGPSAAVSGDHVELAEGRSAVGGEPARGRDFASTLGLGGVLSTRFVWPEAPPGSEDVLLTDEKEALFRKWLSLDRRTRLSEGNFRNLYVHGFDRPEGYCVEKDGRLYYAFFTDDPAEVFDGTLELRGLEPRRYRVRDYVAGRPLGAVEGPRGRLDARFRGYLLLVANAESR
jgi:alpha-galactosidase